MLLVSIEGCAVQPHNTVNNSEKTVVFFSFNY
jgi:hypothetical protein